MSEVMRIEAKQREISRFTEGLNGLQSQIAGNAFGLAPR